MDNEPPGRLRQIERIRANIRRYEQSCGCEVGSIFALGGLIGHFALFTSGRVDWGWGSAGWAGLWVISLSVTGKLIGLGYARIRLVQLRARLNREFARGASSEATLTDPDPVGKRPFRLAASPPAR